MNTNLCLIQCGAIAALLTGSVSGQTIWEAFNDHRIGASTDPNTTGWEMRLTGSGGPLKNIATGADLPVSLMVEEEGGPSDDFGANGTPDAGSPADLLFANKVTIGGAGADGIVGVRDSLATVVRLRFTGLDPTKRYKFRGTTCRGNPDPLYANRWTIFKIVEADSAVAAHVDGSLDQNIFTSATFPAAGLLPDEVALNSGNNLAGSLVGWDNINPGADGTFAIEARQYMGLAPFGDPAAAAVNYGYALNAMYLAAGEPTTGGVGTITNVSNTGGQLKIEWTGAGVLQLSTTLTGWADIAGATSPYTTPMTERRKYYRLRE